MNLINTMASSTSSDEGEIRDGSIEKATKSLSQLDGTSVDRPDRNRSSSSNSTSSEAEYRPRDRRSRDRSRSPYTDRNARGSKRYREDDYSDRPRGDPRRFKVHYEDHPSEYRRRARISYDDIDHGSPDLSDLRYDDRDRFSKRARTRSRSPYRRDREDGRSRRGGYARRGADNYANRADTGHASSYNSRDFNRGSRERSVSRREETLEEGQNSKRDIRSLQESPQQNGHSDGNKGQER